MSTPGSQAALVHLLDWYRSMGADEAVSEVATDWLQRGDVAPGAGFSPTGNGTPSSLPAAPAARSAAPAVTPPQSARQLPTASPDAALTEARAAARSAATLEALRAALAAFDGCALKATAKNLCFFRGAPAARLMLIGEAPGRDEDIEGRPFVGRAGQLLDKMLAAIDLTEADVHITNIVYWRPPGNRTPTPQEAQVCRPFLERQIELVAPEFIVLLGGAAAKHMLDVADGIMRLRGRWREIEVGGRRIKALATLHPAYLLRTPAHKRLAWRDLQAVRAALDGSD